MTLAALYHKVVAMDLSRALGQLADIHQQLAKGEIYRGYRSVPIAASGIIGVVAAWAQAPGLGVLDPIGFVEYWAGIAACAALVGGERDYLQLRSR